MKKRLVSMILSAVLFATSVPVAAFAEDANTQNPVVHSEKGTSQGSNARKESGIDYKKNGGTFAEGYTAPSNYDEPVIFHMVHCSVRPPAVQASFWRWLRLLRRGYHPHRLWPKHTL